MMSIHVCISVIYQMGCVPAPKVNTQQITSSLQCIIAFLKRIICSNVPNHLTRRKTKMALCGNLLNPGQICIVSRVQMIYST